MTTLPAVYGQRDPRWADHQLGTLPGSKIGPVGCYVTSFAMVATAFGHYYTPASLEEALRRNNLFVQGNLVTDDTLAKLHPDLSYEGTLNYAGPADLDGLKRLTDAGRLVICGVDFDAYPRNGVQWHFGVAYDGVDGWADPWYGDAGPMSLYHRDPATDLQKFVIYAGPTPPPAPEPPAAPAEAALLDDPDFAAAKGYFEMAGVCVNLATGIMQLALQAWRRGESRGPAISGEYSALAPDGRRVIRQDFTAGIGEWHPETGETYWVEVVREYRLAHTSPNGG